MIDQEKVLASFLLRSAGWHIFGEERKNNPDLSLPTPWEEATHEALRIISENRGVIDLVPSGQTTFFAEFKRKSDLALPVEGPRFMDFFTTTFHRDMTSEQLWSTAEQVIRGWLQREE